MKVVVASIVVAVACSRSATPPPLVPDYAALGTTHDTTVRSINPRAEDARRQALRAAPAAAQRLLEASNELAGATADPAAIAGALQRLADAIELVAPAQWEAVLRVRESAERLQRTREPTVQAAFVRTGLEAAAHALRVAPIPGGFDETDIRALRLRDAADEVARAAAALDPATALSPQIDTVKLALRESTRAVYAALDEPEPVLAAPATARR